MSITPEAWTAAVNDLHRTLGELGVPPEGSCVINTLDGKGIDITQPHAVLMATGNNLQILGIKGNKQGLKTLIPWQAIAAITEGPA